MSLRAPLLAPDWTLDAACLNHPDAAVLFSDRQDGSYVRRALATCFGCPVRLPCLEAAVRGGESFGIWGGTTADDRKAVRNLHPTMAVQVLWSASEQRARARGLMKEAE